MTSQLVDGWATGYPVSIRSAISYVSDYIIMMVVVADFLFVGSRMRFASRVDQLRSILFRGMGLACEQFSTLLLSKLSAVCIVEGIQNSTRHMINDRLLVHENPQFSWVMRLNVRLKVYVLQASKILEKKRRYHDGA